jgi:kynurenine formamidase
MGIAALEAALRDTEIVELGQYLEERMPTHPSHSKFYKTLWHGFSSGDPCLDYQLILNEHNGTHVDSFGHYINKPGYELIDEIPVRTLCGPCITIDARFLQDREVLEAEHITAWEQANGPIRGGDIVLLDFGRMV